MVSRTQRFIQLLGPDWMYWFPACIVAGGAFEFFKTKFTFMGVNYYTVFRKKQMQRQLDEFENWLKQMDDLSAQATKFTFMGVNYYTVFRKKQMQRQLDEFENWLKQMDDLSAQAVQLAAQNKKS
ncbi:unnamed protein product [Gongylonema pulchrum]|uniref:ATP synthase subunit alpha, mitochondrial n=1 Tax=Gongylonema pulchrum TaxID=637853 RepID=A0A183E632_9BILA|nr:unnamed protein product [Gongylonema pulchrum]